MNHNLTSSQPVMSNGVGNDLITESQKLGNSHPHVTISQEMPKEQDRAFRTKIDNSYQGWDNPFRPEGELSNDAEEILRLWKEGKLKDMALLLKDHNNANMEDDDDNGSGNDVVDNNSTKQPLSQHHQNGDGKASSKNGNPKQLVDIKSSSVNQQQPLKSEKVTIGNEPKKKHGCCSLM